MRLEMVHITFGELTFPGFPQWKAENIVLEKYILPTCWTRKMFGTFFRIALGRYPATLSAERA